MEPRRRFRILKELAEGAFGKVYLAEMITGDSFKSVVAIKLLHGKWLGHQEIVQRSRDEARVLGLLHHRNIVRVEDLTSINGQCAVIMEYLEGVDLKNLLRYCREHKCTVPRKVAFEVIASTSSALDAAYHQKTLHNGQPLELIHRDIKPSNVMLTVAGEIKVLDFGTARATFEDREAETQALAFGSAAYMSPERMMGDPDAPAGDVFALGVTLFEMLRLKAFGKIFVREEKFSASLDERIEGLNLSDLDGEREAQVRSALRLMMAYEPSDRPTAGQVVELMEALADGVQDGSVRRFCREVVLTCHKAVVYPNNPDDPFTGSTLFEDSTRAHSELEDNSGLRGLNVGPSPIGDPERTLVPKEATLEVEPVRTPSVGEEIMPDVLPTISREAPESAFTDSADDLAEEVPHLEVAETLMDAPTEESSLSNLPDPPTDFGGAALNGPPSKYRGMDAPTMVDLPRRTSLLAASIAAIVVMAMGGGAVLALKHFRDAPAPTVESPALEGWAYKPGGIIDANMVEGGGGTLALELRGGSDARVSISGNANDFNYRWDGKEDLSITNLKRGLYRIVVRVGGATTSLQAEVHHRQTCTYQYNLDSGKQEWTEDGCD